jgi:O-antigen/teichoic acid export membrane protein
VAVHLFYWIQTTANRYVLDSQLGVDQVGIFVVAVAAARMPIQSIESIFGQIHQPVLYKLIGQNNGQDVDVRIRQQSYADYVLSFLIITLPVLGFTVLGANLVIRLLAGQSYWQGAEIIPWVSLAEFLRAFTVTSSIAFEVEQQPRSLVFPVGVSSVATIALTFLLSKPLGITGAGIALAAGALIWLILTWIPASQLPCWHMPWRGLPRVFLASLAIVAVAWLTKYLVHSGSMTVENTLFVVVFGISYMLYAGKRILRVTE